MSAMQIIQNKTVEFTRRRLSKVLVFRMFILIGGGRVPIKPPSKYTVKAPLPRIHYTIQVGVFSNIENAIRFTEILRQQDINRKGSQLF